MTTFFLPQPSSLTTAAIQPSPSPTTTSTQTLTLTAAPSPTLTAAPSPTSKIDHKDTDQGGSEESLEAILGIIGALLALVIATAVVICVVVWLRKRKKSDPVDNVVYPSQNWAIKTDTNAAYHTVCANVVTATNEGYEATSVPTSPNAAYQVVPTTRESEDIATSTNEAYVATDIATSVSTAQYSGDRDLVYDYV